MISAPQPFYDFHPSNSPYKSVIPWFCEIFFLDLEPPLEPETWLWKLNPPRLLNPERQKWYQLRNQCMGYVLCNFALPSCWKYSCWPEISQVCFVKYIYPLSEELSQWNRAWQLFLHCSCTGTEWKGQEENNRVNLSPEKSQGNLALQVHFLTLPTPAKTT